MLTQPQRTRAGLRQAIDGGLFAIAALAAYSLRANVAALGLDPLEPLADYWWLVLGAAVTGPVILRAQGLYDPPRPGSGLGTVFSILRACTLTVGALILILFLTRQQMARSVVILVGFLAALLVYARHEFTSWLDAREFARVQLRRRALWVGSPQENDHVRAALTPTERAALEDCGAFDPASAPLDEFVRLLHEGSVNIVILNLAGIDRSHASGILQACAREGVEVLIRPGLLSLPSPRVTIDRFGGEAVFFFRAQSASPGQLAVKQASDYILAAALLAALAPLFALVALAVRLGSRGPVLYRQRRAGLNGRPFVMYKFRSMLAGAEERQPELAARNEMRGPVFKVSDDPRVTRLGRILRRHSLDELPQLWNVLRGEMSLVGPRPLPVEEVGRFDDDAHRRRLSVKPGLTCLWQVSGRSDIADFTDWVKLDLEYIDNWSLWLDARILLATIPVAIFGRGAR